MTAADLALIIVPTGFGIILAVVTFLIIHAVRNYEPGEAVHNLDCRDLYRFGLYATDCPAAHGTDYFASPRAQVEFENAFDGQIGSTK